jgi:hypothetical protein
LNPEESDAATRVGSELGESGTDLHEAFQAQERTVIAQLPVPTPPRKAARPLPRAMPEPAEEA